MTEPVERESRAFGQNPYAAPQKEAAAEVDPALDVSFDELKAYVGPKHLYYWAAWRRARGRGLMFGGFNWAAGALNLIWLLHRKMYLESIWALGLVIGVVALEELLVDASLVEAKAIDHVTNLGLFAVGAFLGNGLYLRRVRRAVAEARGIEPDPVKRNELLALRGGRAWLWPIIATVILASLWVLAATVDDLP